VKRIRAGRMQPGIAALFGVAQRDPARASAYDLGFCLGPRLNAAGRLSDMALGIECLVTDDPMRAQDIARQLDSLNRERRVIEAEMQDAALASLGDEQEDTHALVLFDPAWHQGVIGIVASRLKDRFHRPVIAFARGSSGEIKGSGRSIAGLHLRDALDLVTKRHPVLVLRFGGHAAAAGLTLRESDLDVFRSAFEHTARSLLTAADLQRQVETDGSLEVDDATLGHAHAIASGVWGQGFPEPRFFDAFEVTEQRIVGGRHLRLKLARSGRAFNGMVFGNCDTISSNIEAVYRLDVNEYHGTEALQLTLDYWRPIAAPQRLAPRDASNVAV